MPIRAILEGAVVGGTRRACLTVAAMLAAIVPARADEGDSVSVMPYRPTVSTPAMLSAPGWLEVEAGIAAADLGGADRRDSVPYSAKLAFSDDWGIRIGGEAWVRDPGAPTSTGTVGGDTSLILKRRFQVNQQSAFGLELGATFPTARAGLHSGSGETDYTATGIYSADLPHALHVDLNVGLTRLGAVDHGNGRQQAMWAAALQDAVSARWSVVAELSGMRQSGMPSTSQLLTAASFSPSKHVTWDCGAAHGLGGTGTGWTVFAGMTFLAAHVF